MGWAAGWGEGASALGLDQTTAQSTLTLPRARARRGLSETGWLAGFLFEKQRGRKFGKKVM